MTAFAVHHRIPQAPVIEVGSEGPFFVGIPLVLIAQFDVDPDSLRLSFRFNADGVVQRSVYGDPADKIPIVRLDTGFFYASLPTEEEAIVAYAWNSMVDGASVYFQAAVDISARAFG